MASTARDDEVTTQVKAAFERVERAIRNGSKREALETIIIQTRPDSTAAKAIALHREVADIAYNYPGHDDESYRRLKALEDRAFELRVLLVDEEDEDC